MASMTRIAALGAFARQHPDLFDGESRFDDEDNVALRQRRSLIARFFREHSGKEQMRLAA